jgi:hypothetical protein
MDATSPRLARVHATLDPYPWRRLTAQMLARHVVGAVDALDDPTGSGGPAPRDDRRVEPLVHVLQTQLCQWRALALGDLGRHLLAALDAWEAQDAWLDVELAWLLDARH